MLADCVCESRINGVFDGISLNDIAINCEKTFEDRMGDITLE